MEIVSSFETFLKSFDERVFEIIIMFDDKFLNFPEKYENSKIEEGNHTKYYCGHYPIWTNEENSGNQNNYIFVYSKQLMACNEYLFIVLNIGFLTWLNRSAILTKYWRVNQEILFFIKLSKVCLYKLFPKSHQIYLEWSQFGNSHHPHNTIYQQDRMSEPPQVQPYS